MSPAPPLADTAVLMSPADEDDYAAFLAADPRFHPCAGLPFRDAIVRCYGHEPRYFIARRDGRIRAALPCFRMRGFLAPSLLVSLPFIDGVGALIDAAEGDEADALRDALRAAAIDRGRSDRVTAVEVRGLDWRSDNQTEPAKVISELELAADADTQWKAFKPKVRNQVRKAQRRLTCGRAEPSRLDGFYRLFATTMDRLGVPVHARAFFAALLDTMPEARLILAELDGQAAAGAIALSWGQRWWVPWAAWNHALAADCPNHLLYWTMIEAAIAEGRRVFDFGRSSPGSGPHKYKLQWGASDRPLAVSTWSVRGRHDPFATQSAKWRIGSRVWRRLPGFVTARAGPWLRGQLPS